MGVWQLTKVTHHTQAIFLLTIPTVWPEGSFLSCEEDLSKAARYNSPRKHSLEEISHGAMARALAVWKNMLPGVKQLLLFFFF